MKKKSDKPKRGKTIRISNDVDVSFMDGNLQLYGKKGKLGLDKKNMRVLLNLIRKRRERCNELDCKEKV